VDHRLLPSVEPLKPEAIAACHGRLPMLLFLLLVLLGVARIAATYRAVAQTSDEAPNLACGMQYLDLGRYDYGPFHPPLARVAMAIGPYLYGARSQKLPDRWQEGNAVLASAARYGMTLTLARIGILPFFVLACTTVWLWSRRLLGDWKALAPVFLFVNLPPVLAHAGVATSDMAVCAGVSTAVYAFTCWVEGPNARRSILLGAACAVAFLAKFSAVVFLPLCFVAILFLRRQAGPLARPVAKPLATSALAFFLLVWAAYGFAWGRVSEHIAEDAAGESGILRRVPTAWLHALERLPVPAPKILDGLWQVHMHVEGGHVAYLLGRNSLHGWWYFFPVALAVKVPLGILMLAAAGLVFVIRARRWEMWAPVVSAAAILLVCIPAGLNIGVRYVLPLFPMLAIVAGIGAVYLLELPGRLRPGTAAALMLWAVISASAAHPDYLAYFNEIASRRPERFLVDSDLDWGQDTNRLAQELRRRQVPYLHMACLYTGDDRRLGLPSWDSLEPYRPVTGWVAVSFTMLKSYGWLVQQQQGRGEPAFAWLDRYQPAARIGKSILLYNIPQ